MNRNILILIILSVMAITTTVIVLLFGNGNDDNSDPERVSHYCEKYPEAIMCTEDNPIYEDVAVDLFDDLLALYPFGYEEELCEDYFYGKVIDYCKTGRNTIMPVNTSLIDPNDYTIVNALDTNGEPILGIFDIITLNRITHESLWTFRIAIVIEHGIYVMSGLSYIETKTEDNLELTADDVNLFMETMISDSGLGTSSYCIDYFRDEAFTTCFDDVVNVVPSDNITYNYIVTETDINTYTYVVTDELSTMRYTFSVVFTTANDHLYISSIEYVEEVIE